MSLPHRGRGLICLVTDRRRLDPDDERAAVRLVELVSAAARAGVDLIQVRERDLDARCLCELVGACVRAATGTAARVLVNDRVDVALAAGAAGVHLRADSPSSRRVRAIVPAGFLIGRSVHSAGEAASVSLEGGLDYLMFGTVFPSASKDAGHAVAGVAELGRAVRQAKIPVLAIGGVAVERVQPLAAAGAAGVAAIGLFAVSPGTENLDDTLAAVVRRLRAAFDTSGVVP